MKLSVRAHDLGVKGERSIIEKLDALQIGGIQLVCHKAFDDVPYAPDGLAPCRAREIGGAFQAASKRVDLIGAYFNPVHPDAKKAELGERVFCDMLRNAKELGGAAVASETGSYRGDPWTYHPQNRTKEALDRVVEVFGRLCAEAEHHGVEVGIEGATGHVCYDVKTLSTVAQRIGMKNLRVVFDLYNFMGECPREGYLDILKDGIQSFGARIACFHIKDCAYENGAWIQRPVGQGELEFSAILSLIKEHYPRTPLVLEGTVEPYLAGSVALLKQKWKGE